MAPLYADGRSKMVATVVAESWIDDVPACPGMKVDWFVNEDCDTLVIEGHVDLSAADEAMQRESSGYDFPAPRHAWMRSTRAPDGEPIEAGYGWRGECQRGDRGAEPVTISVRNT